MKGSSTTHIEPPIGPPARGETFRAHRILVVDDDSNIRQLSAKVLRACGYRVDIAEDGSAGWEALQECTYDLLITDHNMPKISGVELVKKLRAARMTLPVVLASGSIPAEASNAESALQLAATLLKPYTCEELSETVNRIVHAVHDTRERLEPLSVARPQPPGMFYVA